MQITFTLNHKKVTAEIAADTVLLDLVRSAEQGAEQCGFCNPGFIMNALALFRENPDPGEDEIKEYLAGNLCRCSGYEGQLRGILNFLAWKKGKEAAQ